MLWDKMKDLQICLFFDRDNECEKMWAELQTMIEMRWAQTRGHNKKDGTTIHKKGDKRREECIMTSTRIEKDEKNDSRS